MPDIWTDQSRFCILNDVLLPTFNAMKLAKCSTNWVADRKLATLAVWISKFLSSAEKKPCAQSGRPGVCKKVR